MRLFSDERGSLCEEEFTGSGEALPGIAKIESRSECIGARLVGPQPGAHLSRQAWQ